MNNQPDRPLLECRMCKTPLVTGIAIDPGYSYRDRGWVIPTLKAKDIKLIDVYKCPKCGDSEIDG